ncbi:MerR family transcriptional regulator [Aeromicrobium sp. P5_D10]
MLTIGQIAAHAGVTVRAVRHYHAKGLLPEPTRDASGYRRYDAKAVVELIKIRTLADAGVPLAKVEELLRADDTEFASAVAQIDVRLRAEIRERQRHRERIAKLAAGDSLALPPEAVAYLERLRSLGMSERMIEGERDGWILLAAHSPDRMALWMQSKFQQLDDPEVVALYREFEDLVGWEPDDPRLPELADRLAATIAAADFDHQAGDLMISEELVELLDNYFLNSVPAGAALVRLLKQRGWSGWTQFEPVAAGDMA